MVIEKHKLPFLAIVPRSVECCEEGKLFASFRRLYFKLNLIVFEGGVGDSPLSIADVYLWSVSVKAHFGPIPCNLERIPFSAELFYLRNLFLLHQLENSLPTWWQKKNVVSNGNSVKHLFASPPYLPFLVWYAFPPFRQVSLKLYVNVTFIKRKSKFDNLAGIHCHVVDDFAVLNFLV